MIKEILKTFNEMLHSGKYTRQECYDWLMSQRALHPEIPDFAFLYPEELDTKIPNLSDIPTSYLVIMRDSIYGDGKNLDTPEYKKMYNAINSEIYQRQQKL